MNKESITQAAQEYINNGWKITTDSGGETYDKGWNNAGYCAPVDACAEGVGIKTGKVSNNLVILDPDKEIAVRAANRLLPANTLRSGHSGKWTHAYFTCPDSPEKFSRQFTDTKVIVEILAENKRAAAPPSPHKSGNVRYWSHTDITPTTMKAREILRYARMIATAYWVAEKWAGETLHAWELSVLADLIKNRGLDADEAFDIVDLAHEHNGYYSENEDKKKVKLQEAVDSTSKLDSEKMTTSFEDCDITELQKVLRDVWRKTPEEVEEEAWAACSDLARKPDILAETYKLCQSAGLVGEEKNAKLLSLITATRAMRKPMSGILEGNTSGGKSFTLKLVLDMLPEDAKYILQSMSDKALAHIGKYELTDKFLVLYELGGIGSKDSDALEMVKQLLTEGRIRRLIANSTQRGVEPKMLETEGPTGLLTTTTRYKIDDELTSRVFKLKVDDTPTQNKRVVGQIFNRKSRKRKAPDYSEVRALHTWLYAQDNRVDIPYLDFIGESIPAADTRIRRDASKIIDLIEASAVLHQVSRERNAAGEIVATLEDYATVRALVEDIVGEGSEVKIHPKVRETVEMARELLNADVEVSPSNMAQKLGTTSQNAGRRLGSAESRGLLKESGDNSRRRKVYVMGEKMPEDSEMLPTVEILSERLNGSITEGGGSHDSEGNVSPDYPFTQPFTETVDNRSLEVVEESITDKTVHSGHVQEAGVGGTETNRSPVHSDHEHHSERVPNGSVNGSVNGRDEDGYLKGSIVDLHTCAFDFSCKACDYVAHMKDEVIDWQDVKRRYEEMPLSERLEFEYDFELDDTGHETPADWYVWLRKRGENLDDFADLIEGENYD